MRIDLPEMKLPPLKDQTMDIAGGLAAMKEATKNFPKRPPLPAKFKSEMEKIVQTVRSAKGPQGGTRNVSGNIRLPVALQKLDAETNTDFGKLVIQELKKQTSNAESK